MRLGLALLAAFIAGLVTQRVLLGKYAITLPFGLGTVPEVTDEQTSNVTENAEKDAALKAALAESKRGGPEADLELIEDPRLKMVAATAKLESALRAKAQSLEAADADAPIGQVIEGLATKTRLGHSGAAAIRGTLDIGTQVVAGAELEPGVEHWVDDVGQHLPGAVEALD